MVCLPYAGGSAFLFRLWAGALADVGIGLVALQPPGRADRLHEPAHRRVGGLAAEAACELDLLAGVPYALFGHSMGGVVAFELALRAAASGLPTPVHLLVAAHRAPHDTWRTSRRWHHLDDDGFLRELRTLGGVTEEFVSSPELVRLMMPALRADFEALAAYEPPEDGRVACPITVLGGSDDPQVSSSDLGRWRAYTSGAFHAMTLPGGHFFPWEGTADFPALLASLFRQGGPRNQLGIREAS